MSELTRIVELARDERCLLQNRWEEGAVLSGRDQLKLARELAKIKPARIEKHGWRVPCEPTFELRPKDRRRLTEALLIDGRKDGEILSVVPGLTRRTFDRVKAGLGLAKTPPANGSTPGRFETKRSDPVGRPEMAYLDATSGGNVEAARRFRELTNTTNEVLRATRKGGGLIAARTQHQQQRGVTAGKGDL